LAIEGGWRPEGLKERNKGETASLGATLFGGGRGKHEGLEQKNRKKKESRRRQRKGERGEGGKKERCHGPGEVQFAGVPGRPPPAYPKEEKKAGTVVRGKKAATETQRGQKKTL